MASVSDENYLVCAAGAGTLVLTFFSARYSEVGRRSRSHAERTYVGTGTYVLHEAFRHHFRKQTLRLYEIVEEMEEYFKRVADSLISMG